MGRTVLITGAAQGLGQALAKVFLEKGWSVIATDSDPSFPLWAEAGQLWSIRMDVTRPEEVLSVPEKLMGSGISLDLIINNAGIDRYFPFSEAAAEELIRVFEVNLFGSFRVNRAFLPLLKQPGGRIIHIGSESYSLRIPFMPYPLTKDALESYVKVLRQELHFLGIGVTLVRPGAIDTALLDQVRNIRREVKDPVIAEVFGKFAQTAPEGIGKILGPAEVAERIFKISGKKRLRHVYRINNMFRLKLLRFIPYPVLERLIRRMMQ